MKAASHRASIAAIIISLQLSSLVSSSASFCCGERSNYSKYRCIYPALSSRGSVKLHRSVAEVVDFPIPQRLSSRMHIFPPVSALGSVSATGVGNIGGLVPTCKCLSGATSAVPHPTVDTCEQRVSLSKGVWNQAQPRFIVCDPKENAQRPARTEPGRRNVATRSTGFPRDSSDIREPDPCLPAGVAAPPNAAPSNAALDLDTLRFTPLLPRKASPACAPPIHLPPDRLNRAFSTAG